MPSDERIATALGTMARPIAEFRAALASAVAQARRWLDAVSIDAPARTRRAAHELGEFAAGRINPVQFGETFAFSSGAAPEERAAMEQVVLVLDAILAEGDDAFFIDVAPGESLARAVDDALARLGRAFGAIRMAELVRGHRYGAPPSVDASLLDHLPFRAWTRQERRLAPPLVVSVDGADVHAGGLAEFTDGRVKIVLVVRGECAPAALVRLITPGTLVLQTVDATGLAGVAAADGPAIAAMVPDTAARFQHDPTAGREAWQRISVWGDAKAPARALGGSSAWHMAEDLRQLAALASAPTGTTGAPPGAAAAPDTTERLARWLLGQADVA
jgi:hypothetical protein